MIKTHGVIIEEAIVNSLTSVKDTDLEQLVSDYSTRYYVTERYGERWNNGKL